jgi:large subunit ribosomal protein L6
MSTSTTSSVGTKSTTSKMGLKTAASKVVKKTKTSRVGRKPITIPSGVDIKVQGQELVIKGTKGHITLAIHPSALVVFENGEITVSQNTTIGHVRGGSGSKLNDSIIGTTRATISNFIFGVSQGYERKLTLVGVGYRASTKGKELNLTLGFSHPVSFTAPEGITIEVPSQTEILIKGIDKHLVGHVASKIREFRKPEPYKGKGVRYSNEIIVIKETKKK